MSKINPINISNLSDVPTLVRFLSPFCNQTQAALANGLNFQDNFVDKMVVVYFGSTTSQHITHNLGVTAIGYLPIMMTTATTIWNGSSLVLGATFANLRSTVAGVTVTLLFF